MSSPHPRPESPDDESPAGAEPHAAAEPPAGAEPHALAEPPAGATPPAGPQPPAGATPPPDPQHPTGATPPTAAAPPTSATPPSPPPRPRLRSRRTPLLVGAALVSAGLLGWLAFAGISGGSGAGGGGAAAPRATAAGDDGKRAGMAAASGSLRGKVVVIDPGHNSGNARHTSEIGRKVDIGTGRKECDTTGTETNAGYSEARFTLDLAHRLRTLLQQRGATVKLTHDGDSPAWGPCVDERARIGNAAHADAAISLHADGSVQGHRGFHVILPAAVHRGAADTRPIAAASRRLGTSVAAGFRRATGEPPSNYVGGGTGLVTRGDLGGLNLSTVPKVFIECGDMRDSKDAASLISGAWRQKAAEGISEGIAGFLHGS
ncbi:N-acetylmuramoyl-L-alanine amidase [Streptomyces sp. NPDC046985]|uniref:N-acetylmuramoyl-L-alanine amidase n=1 Tax=Streptomyces sp. NPDC046985 TaxID=3155377 RepID=UPI0033CE3959